MSRAPIISPCLLAPARALFSEPHYHHISCCVGSTGKGNCATAEGSPSGSCRSPIELGREYLDQPSYPGITRGGHIDDRIDDPAVTKHAVIAGCNCYGCHYGTSTTSQPPRKQAVVVAVAAVARPTTLLPGAVPCATTKTPAVAAVCGTSMSLMAAVPESVSNAVAD